jgi:hypothetical protein
VVTVSCLGFGERVWRRVMKFVVAEVDESCDGGG